MVTRITVIKELHGVELKEVTLIATNEIIYYEIYIDGEWVNKFKQKKTAFTMWRDLSGC